MDTYTLERKVIEWARDRNILANSVPSKQVEKTIEEANEIKVAISENNLEEIKDGIGDTIVTLIILAHMCGTCIEECLNQAYDVIKNRTGTMKDGIFVKDTQ